MEQELTGVGLDENNKAKTERSTRDGTTKPGPEENNELESNQTALETPALRDHFSKNLVQPEIVEKSFNENNKTITESSTEDGTKRRRPEENEELDDLNVLQDSNFAAQQGDKICSNDSAVNVGIPEDVNDEDGQNSHSEGQEKESGRSVGDGKDKGISSFQVFFIAFFIIALFVFIIISSSVVKVPPQHYAHPLQDPDPGGSNVSSVAKIPAQQAYSQRNLRAGDIIIIPRLYGLYYHFAIYVGNGSVVHLTGNILEFAIWKVKVKKEKLEDISIPEGTLIERGTWKGKERLPVANITERFLSKVDARGYYLFSYNCETFVRWTVYGEEGSEQPNGFQIIVLGLMILSFMFALRVFLISVSKFVLLIVVIHCNANLLLRHIM